MTWQPTKILRQTGSVPSSTGPAIVVTDDGLAVIKTLGNPEGPHALAREWIVTRLANWFGLQTFDIAQTLISDFEEITNGKDSRLAEPGMAVATRFETGKNWDGKSTTLSLLENSEDISKIVVFDSWVRNRDRHRPPNRQNLGNVFLSEENAAKGRLVLKAIDHTHCLAEGDLDAKITKIANVKDETIYGLFPGFYSRIDNSQVTMALARMQAIDRQSLMDVIGNLPSEWSVSADAIVALVEFLLNRANFLAQHLPDKLIKAVQQNLEGFEE